MSSNLTQPQLFVADADRILYWNNPSTETGEILLTNGNTASGVLQGVVGGEGYHSIKATANYLYVATASGPAGARVFIYGLPVGPTSTPMSFAYPSDLRTIDGQQLQHSNTRDTALFIEPTRDDQYLWLGVIDDNRIMRVRNPRDPQTRAVDIILGQTDPHNDGCNSHKVTPWTEATQVQITGNTIERIAANGTPTGTPTIAGARSEATIVADPHGGVWYRVKGYAQMEVDQLGYNRAFGLKSTSSPPGHDYNHIDYHFVLKEDNSLETHVKGLPTIYSTTYAIGDRLRVSLEYFNGAYHIGFYKNSSLVGQYYRIQEPARVDFPLYFEGSIASPGGRIYNAYLAATIKVNATSDSLCLSSSAVLDRKGNLWVSDHSLEQQGNMRLLQYDASLFPSTPPTTVLYGIPATRIFADLGTWQPAFDRQNNLFIGYNHYTNIHSGAHNPYPPTPLPGTPTADPGFLYHFTGRFPGVYVNPLYPLPSYTSTPAPTSSPSPTPTPTSPAPSPNALLADLYSQAYSATFDEHDNLYVRDLNRSKVMIYRQPGHGTPVVWATPLVNATVTPSSNSIQKTSGTNEAWDSGAVSAQAIGSSNGGNGYVMISVEGRPTNTPTATPTPGSPTPTPGCCTSAGALNTRRAFGLSSSSRFHAHRLQDIQFAFVLTGTNSLDIYESGVFVFNAGTYDYNDVLKVAVEDAPNNQGKVVRYYRNGGAVYTNTIPLLDYPLQLDTSIATMGGRIANAFISGDSLVTCSASGWCTGTSVNGPGSPSPTSVLNGVAVISPNNIWAVGGYSADGTTYTSLIEKWDGTQWSRVTLPTNTDVGMLHGVSAAVNQGVWYMWAVGDQGVLFYDGSTNSWSRASTPSGGKGVYARTTTDVWTVGSSAQGIQRWNGSSWSRDTTSIPAGSTLNGVTVISASNVWAVGMSPTQNPPNGTQALTMRWNGSSWSTVSAPSPGNVTSLAGVDGYDANHIWAVGTYIDIYDTLNGSRNLTMYWNGTQWTVVSAPNPGGARNHGLKSVRFTKEGTAWAVGHYYDQNFFQQASILLWDGTAWKVEQNPSPGTGSMLMGLATIAGSSPVVNNTWAVGSYTPRHGAPAQTLVESLKAPSPPLTTTTYYMTSISQSTHYSLGCQAGLDRESGIIVLDYGQPRLWNNTPPLQYGTLLIGSQDKAYITDPDGLEQDITTAVQKFILGYAECQPQQSFETPAHASIAIATNNNNLDGQAALTSGHAQAWAGMVATVQAYVINNKLDSLVDVQSAIDLQPDWSTYALAHDWAQAYSSQGVSYLYNYGSTNGYPKVPPGEPTPVVPPPWAYSKWDSKQLYYLSGGLDPTPGGGVPGMVAVPQILHLTLAKGWHAVTSWAVNSGRLPLQFGGTASASTLCPGNTLAPGTGACFQPQQAWQVFFHELSADFQPGVPQLADRATDIKCSNGSNAQSCK